MPRIDWLARVRDRKENYIEHTTDLTWIDLNMLRWEFRLPKIDLSIGFNLIFNFLLDFYLAIDLHFPFEEFDFEMPNFLFDWTPIGKAYYGKSKYNWSIYDPPEVLWKDLARFLWNLRYKTTDKSVPDYKNMSKTLAFIIQTYKDIIKGKGVHDIYLDGMVEALLKAEGKVLNTAYVGFTVVGVGKVMKSVQRRRYKLAIGYLRWTDDYKTLKPFYTKFPYETQVNYARVNYARVIPREDIYKEKHLRPLAKNLAERIREFKKRSSKTPITKGLDVEVRPEIKEITKQIEPPKHTLYQRTFFLQKRYELEWEGGKHQARLQHIIERVKPILNKYGVAGNLRLGYITFAKEYVYMNYKPHRKHKQWKRILTEDDLILKYKRMGCDEQILREIITAIKTFKVVVDKESTQKAIT